LTFTPAEGRTPDVLGLLTSQRSPGHGSAVVRLADGEAGLAARTIARRLSSVRGLFDYWWYMGMRGCASIPCRTDWLRGNRRALEVGGACR
jgi:integrase/recombinase XerD